MLRILLLASLTALALAQDFPTTADAYVQSWTRDGQFRGAILVAKDGQPIFRKGYGLANSEWDIPNSPETKFRLVPRPPEMVPLVSKRFPCGFPIEPPIDLGSCFVNTAAPCRGFFA